MNWWRHHVIFQLSVVCFMNRSYFCVEIFLFTVLVGNSSAVSTQDIGPLCAIVAELLIYVDIS